jgi:hypothetical protein
MLAAVHRGLLIALACACGGTRDDAPSTGSAPPEPSNTAAEITAVGSAAPDPGASVAPATTMLEAIPADAAFVFVTLDPIDGRLRDELAARLRHAEVAGPAFAATRRVWRAAQTAMVSSLAKGGLRSLGVDGSARLAIYGTADALVLRVELADPALAERAVEQIVTAAGVARRRQGAAWLVDDGPRTLLVTVAGSQLVVALGDRAVIDRRAAALVGRAATPVTEAALRAVVQQHGFVTAAGWIDPGPLAASHAGLVDVPAPCRAAIVELFGALPRVAVGFSALDRDGIAIDAIAEVGNTVAAALAAARDAAPSLPGKLAGDPLFALAFIAPPDGIATTWRTRTERYQQACAPDQAAAWGPPWNTIEAGAVVIYDARWQGLPLRIDAFAALQAGDPAAILGSLAHHVPKFRAPRDAGPFVTLRWPHLPALEVARRGNRLLATIGARGKPRLADFSVREGGPLLRVHVDAQQIRARTRTGPGTVSDDEFFVSTARVEDPFGAVVAGLFGKTDLAATLEDARVRIRLATRIAPRPRPAPPRRDRRLAIRDRCVAILEASFDAIRPALARLGVTQELDDIAASYLTSFEADLAVRSCAELDDEQRACLAASANPLADATRCAPKPGYDDSVMRFPTLFSMSGPRPLEARFHPPLDPAEAARLRARLVGTWVREGGFGTETWTIDAAGDVIIEEVPRDGKTRPKTSRRRIALDARGQLVLHDGTVRSTRQFLLVADDRFILGGNVVAVARQDRFVAKLGSDFLVVEPGRCSAVTYQGLLVPATCTRDGDDLEIKYAPPCLGPVCEQTRRFRFVAGFFVERTALDRPYVRRP